MSWPASSLQNCQEGRPCASGQTGTNSGVCVLWGHQPTHMAASSRLRPRPVSQPRRSGSEARQSALQVDKGCGIPASQAAVREAVLPGPALPASAPARSGLPLGPLLGFPASIPNLPLVEQPGPQLANDGEHLLQGLHKSCHSFLKTSLQQPLISWGCCNHVPQSGGFKHRNVFSRGSEGQKVEKGV